MKLAVIGLGYVGTTTAACLASLGHHIVGIDIAPEKVALVSSGLSPVVEPGLDELLHKAVESGLLTASLDLSSALESVDAALICVGTPSTREGDVDVSHLKQTIQEIARVRQETAQVIAAIVRSTLLPGQHRAMMASLQDSLGDAPIAYCVHPEFLRAGQAMKDFMEPPMIVFGCSDSAAEAACAKLYPGFTAKTVHCDPAVAALAKYACNCFHAVKVTFANEMGVLAHAMDVDPREVMKLLCLDKKLNISEKYLQPGFAFGGSCLPKDLRGLLHFGHHAMTQIPMLTNVLASNTAQIERAVREILNREPKRIGLFGLAFKDNTDDVRESPMIELAERLAGKGVDVRIYDPNLSLPRMVGENRRWALEKLPHIQRVMVAQAKDAVQNCDCVVLARYFPELNYDVLPWSKGQFVLDLHGNASYAELPISVYGLAWPNTGGNEPWQDSFGNGTALRSGI